MSQTDSTALADLAHRLWPHTRKEPDGCIIWLGSCEYGGYGHLRFQSKSIIASRAAWLLTYGPIPAGQFVCHRCDNRRCINPAHLFLATHRDNMADLKRKGRNASGPRHLRKRQTFDYLTLGGPTIGQPRKPLQESFWNHVHKTATCWLWTGPQDSDGYGRSRTWFNNRYVRRVHRFSYLLHIGPIPDDMCVCHHCDNRLCVNPDHLFVATHTDNIADRHRKGRTAKGEKLFPPHRRLRHGETHPDAKLTDADVRIIRACYAQGGITMQKLAEQYSVTSGAINGIVSGKTWKHVE